MAYFAIGSPDLAAQNFTNKTQSWRNNNSSKFCLYIRTNYDPSAGAGTFFPGTSGNVNAPNSYNSLRKC